MRISFRRLLTVLLLPLTLQLGEVAASAQVAAPDSAVGRQSEATRQKTKEKKNPTSAVLRSLAVPGWGQFYNGQKIKAAIVCAGETALIGTAIYWDRQVANATDDRIRFVYRDYRNQALWFLAGTIVLSMLDAYIDAQLADFDDSPSLASLPLHDDRRNHSALWIGVRVRL